MQHIHAATALLPDGWHRDLRISIDTGRIAAIETGAGAAPGDERVAVLIPGLPNLHSHAFQRGMAGLAEIGGPAGDSFWTWRQLMYRFALEMTPEGLDAIAVQLYVEMLEAGFTRAGEFHYLHHDRDGLPYDDIGELSARIVSASVTSGIRLTLLPVFYAHGDFGGAPPVERQGRFVTSLDGFTRLLDRCRELTNGVPGAVIGVAPHSLRAVTPEQLQHLIAMHPEGPIHIHAAEQVREVEACLAWSGQRPVEWLLDHAGIDHRWTVVHATHLNDREVARLAASEAVAGLCPVTEANLGDGTFQGRAFRHHGGRFGIGSDSNVQVDPAAELRQLEYSQRLAHRERNVLADEGVPTTRALLEASLAGGSQALGAEDAAIRPGAPADLISLDSDRIDLADGDGALAQWIFTGNVAVDCVWVGGELLVEAGRHRDRDAVNARFRHAMRTLARAM